MQTVILNVEDHAHEKIMWLLEKLKGDVSVMHAGQTCSTKKEEEKDLIARFMNLTRRGDSTSDNSG